MKTKIIILLFLIIVLIGGYLFIRALPTIFINKPIHFTYVAALKVQEIAGKNNQLFFPEQYKKEVEKYLAESVPKSEKEIDKTILEVNKLYDDYLKNPSKELSLQDYANKLNDYERELDSIGLDVYIEVLKITDKHLLIPFGALPTCYRDVWANAFMPYIEKYNIDYKKLIELEKYIDNQHKELNEISDKIFDYKIPKDDNKSCRMIYSYPKQGIYYYYYKDFKPTNFKKPNKVVPVNGNYTMYIYDENWYYNNFSGRTVWNKKEHAYDYIKIKEDDAGYLYDMHITGLELKPKYLIHNNNQDKYIDVCEFKKDSNLQIKYSVDRATGKVIKKIEFDNGPIGFPNACNPDWEPGTDI